MANHDPIFISVPVHWDAVLSNQIFPRDGGTVTGTPVLLGTVGGAGGVISSVTIQFTGNCSNNVCMLFVAREGSAIALKRCELEIEAISNSNNTTALYSKRFSLPDEEAFEGRSVYLLKLAPSESLYVALLQPEPSSKIIVHAVGGLYEA